jgi:cryptochrome
MRVLYWFRKDLRVCDNIALKNTLQGATELIPVYVIHQPTTLCGANRWQFLLESLHDLDEQLRELNSRLVIIKGDPRKEIPKISSQWEVQRVGMEILHEPHGVARDDEISGKLNCEVLRSPGTLLYDHSTLKRAHTYQRFCDQVRNIKVSEPIAITIIPKLPAGLDLPTYWPMLSEFHSEKPTTSVHGGTKEGLRRLTEYCSNVDRVSTFEKPNSSPCEFDPPSTTLLSPFILWGCISCRQMFYAFQQCMSKSKKKCSQPPVSLIGQLLWREFFHFQGVIVPNYDKMEGNPLCRQIPWRSALKPGDEGYNDFQKWKEGKTGYPWIDALMRQLKETGWMHHLGRHSVACFLTRGDLFIHWERGKEHFQEYLIDHDWNLNAGNWMWLSASAYFSQYFRVYGPVSFPSKYDKTGKLVRRYVPELKNVPQKYIYEPWKMSAAQQKLCGVTIGIDYPMPMIDHSKASKECIQRMKEAFEDNKLSGKKRTWSEA